MAEVGGWGGGEGGWEKEISGERDERSAEHDSPVQLVTPSSPRVEASPSIRRDLLSDDKLVPESGREGSAA